MTIPGEKGHVSHRSCPGWTLTLSQATGSGDTPELPNSRSATGNWPICAARIRRDFEEIERACGKIRSIGLPTLSGRYITPVTLTLAGRRAQCQAFGKNEPCEASSFRWPTSCLRPAAKLRRSIRRPGRRSRFSPNLSRSRPTQGLDFVQVCPETPPF
jgi:hypothetical protein